MTESTATESAGASAGALLRAARERQGMHVAALAATIKIPQRKLEALEADRYGDLPDATFTRALALTVCRALKLAPEPVLALLPQTGGKPLADVAG
ncbi:MAG TPA: helix-turn-helix transcriptional regulator, partial [Rubrivivax sp.]|nr:helix-turn-helix transcriptional regulator [Rubrivivax sp.]